MPDSLLAPARAGDTTTRKRDLTMFGIFKKRPSNPLFSCYVTFYSYGIVNRSETGLSRQDAATRATVYNSYNPDVVTYGRMAVAFDAYGQKITDNNA